MQSSPTRISWDQQNCRASHFRPQDRELPIPNTLPKRKEEGRVCGAYFIICNSSFSFGDHSTRHRNSPRFRRLSCSLVPSWQPLPTPEEVLYPLKDVLNAIDVTDG